MGTAARLPGASDRAAYAYRLRQAIDAGSERIREGQANRFNADLKPKYEQSIKAGKVPKQRPSPPS